MKITRGVILDLLPLYVAGEGSPDTRALVEQYLETDPELAEMARRIAAMHEPEDIPIPIGEEDQMEAYKEAQRRILQRTLIWGAVIALGILSLLGLAFLVLMLLVPVT
jgi:anti-sigma factor RsiW